MAKISQVQFPPLRSLEALSRGESIKRHKVLIDFLPQFSENWKAIRKKADQWNESIDKLVRKQKKRGYLNKELLAQRQVNVEDYMDHACRWIQRHDSKYFSALLRVFYHLRRLATPEPVVVFKTILESKSNSEGYEVRIQKWGRHRICIAEQRVAGGPAMELPKRSATFRRSRVSFQKIWDALLATELVDPHGKVFWRNAERGQYSHYRETWHQFPRFYDDDLAEINPGSAYLVILYDLVGPEAKVAIEKMEVFLERKYGVPDLMAMQEFAQREAPRLEI